MKIVINKRYGGFGLSDAAYEKLIEYGIPVCKYVPEVRDPETGLYPQMSEDEVIFDRDLTPEDERSKMDNLMRKMERYWETWLRNKRDHPLLLRVVEELGDAANGKYSSLKIVEIPDSVEWVIEEYDGQEWVAEKHRTWS